MAYICDRNTITLWDMNRLAGAKPGDSFQDLIWQYYQQKARECYELGHMEEFLGWRQTMGLSLAEKCWGLPFITGAVFAYQFAHLAYQDDLTPTARTRIHLNHYLDYLFTSITAALRQNG